MSCYNRGIPRAECQTRAIDRALGHDRPGTLLGTGEKRSRECSHSYIRARSDQVWKFYGGGFPEIIYPKDIARLDCRVR